MVEAIYCYDTACVRFAVYEEGRRILVDIGEDALRDVFGACGGGESLLDSYRQHAPLIDALALERHHAAPGAPILLGIADFGAIPSVVA
ncbi:DUF1488 family protein [Variovorax sp. OV329]|uniref:DUF1488 family protein n=1 Tax=Variovorax sp. OV329 TaxID=1882825 RepID=UPI0008E95D71|nr:DUF1488 family protein [Variovorax sp. OV329]SFM64172.1 Protein of unknown function [Variovorax sp. OV329]